MAALAQTPAQTPAKASMEGQVVNAVTGEPLRKATVVARSIDSRRAQTPYGAQTDGGGNFVLRGLDAGAYRLSAERTGFVRTDFGRSGAGRSASSGAIVVEDGQKVTDLVIKMSPQAVITGRVLDPDGDPIVHAAVSVLKFTYLRGRRQLTPAGGASTDDQGEYRLHSLQPGKYYVSAVWQPGGLFGMGRMGPAAPGQAQPPEETYAPTYYPRAVDITSAVIIDAAPGAVVRNIDIQISKIRTVQVSGRIVDPSGGAGRNTMVMAVPRDVAAGVAMLSGRGAAQVQDGRFVIRGLRPGSYVISAERWENNGRLSARLPVEVGDTPVEGLSLMLSPGLTVTGTIRVDGSDKVELAGVNLWLNAAGDAMAMSTVTGRSKSDGSFSIANAAPDTYQLTLAGVPENCYVKSMRMGEEDVLGKDLNLARGGGAPIDIVLSPTAGSVEAVVLDAKQQPAGGVTVVAVPDGARAESQQFYKFASTDQYGRATLRGLAPGEYKLYAWEDVESNAWLDPDFRKQYERQGESLSIRESSREAKQLAVLTGGDGARP
jgi:hypothetical protein